jgi:F0F1-type ATP synthase membrane subunit c/vacuolar-type H+-ATPase subunit K
MTPDITPSTCPGLKGTAIPSWGMTNSAPSQSPTAQSQVIVFFASFQSMWIFSLVPSFTAIVKKAPP